MTWEQVLYKATAQGKKVVPLQTAATKATLQKMAPLGDWLVSKGLIEKNTPYSVAFYILGVGVSALYEQAKKEMNIA